MSLDERKWLFTADPADTRGNLAGVAFFTGEPIKASQAELFMKVQSYERKSDPDQRDADIHDEFVSFIVDAATFASEIDPATGAIGVSPTDPAIQAEAAKNADYVRDTPLNIPVSVEADIANEIRRAKPDYESAIASGNAAQVAKVRDDLRMTLARLIRSKVVAGSSAFATLSNTKARKVYDEVFAKWDKLSGDAQGFYNKFVQLQKKGAPGWTPAPESEYATAGTRPGDYRLNLKKHGSTGKVLLGESLPLYDKTVFDRIWYKSTSVTSTSAPGENVFRELYDAIYKGNNAAADALLPGISLVPSGNKIFNVKVDDLVRRRMFAVSKATIPAEAKVPDAEKQYSMLDMLNKQIISRDANGNLKVKIDNKEYDYGVDDVETTKAMKATHNCYGTYVKATGEDCKKFMFEALLQQDQPSIQALIDSFKVKDFYKVATSDIKNMHPVIALRILQQFGFHKYQAYDEVAGSQLYKVEDVNHWLKNYMTKKFTDKQVQDMISDNGTYQILSYLDLVSQFVNANPAILNKNYSGSSAEAAGKLKRSPFAEKLKLDWYKPVPQKSQAGFDFDRFRRHLGIVRTMRSPFNFSPFGSQFTPGVGMMQMVGGQYTIPRFSGQVTGAKLIHQYVQAVLQDLRAKNKTLSPTEEKRIKANIEKLMELENEMLRTLAYYDEYNRLKSALKDYKAETIDNEDYVKKFVDRYQTLDGKYQSTENLVIEVIAKVKDLTLKDDKNYVAVDVGQLQLPK